MNGPLQPEQRIRLDVFRRNHPNITIGCEFGEWHAMLPMGAMHDPSLGELLDKLDAITGPRADSG